MSDNDVGADGARGDGLLGVLQRADVLAGLFFIFMGTLGIVLAQGLEVGTAVQMGAAYMPRLVSFALIGLGAVILLIGLVQAGGARVAASEPISWRSLLLVPLAVFTFGFAIERIGLVLSILLTVVVASTATAGQKPLAVAIAAVGLSVMCTALFVWGLDLPFSILIPDR